MKKLNVQNKSQFLDKNSNSDSKMFWDFVLIAGLVVLGIFSRLLPHPWNFTAVGATALFAGSALRRHRWAMGLPLLVLLASDWILGMHPTLLYVYGAYLLTSLLGTGIPDQNYFKAKQIVRIGFFSVSSSLLFYVLTNFGAWIQLDMYSKDLAGLTTALVAGVPFLKNQALGDLFYNGILFGCYQLARVYLTGTSRHSIADSSVEL